MKTKKLLLIPLIALLCACSNDEPKTDDNPSDNPAPAAERTLSLITPTGAPAVAMSYLAASTSDKVTLETTANPSLLKGYFAGKNYDVIVAPTDVGVKAIQEGCDYKLAATITSGNFYLVSTGLDENNTLDSDDSIVLFQQNGLPDKIFHYVYGDAFNSNITYVTNVAVAGTVYAAKEVTNADGVKVPVDYVLLAEPKLTALKITTGITDLSAAFAAKSQTSKVFQASIFVINNKEPEVGNFLKDAKANIEEMLADTNKITENMSKKDDPATFFGIAPQAAKNITNKNNGLALTYLDAYENKDAIIQYMDILGVKNVNEEVFYK